MIDAQIAEAVTERLVVGAMVDVRSGDGLEISSLKLLEVSPYSVTVQGSKNKLTVPINWLMEYVKDEEEMTRMSGPALQAGAKPRGRPRKTETQAPVDVTAGRVLMQGGTNMGQAGQVQQPIQPAQPLPSLVVGQQAPDGTFYGAHSGQQPPPGSQPIYAVQQPPQQGMPTYQPGAALADPGAQQYQPQPQQAVAAPPATTVLIHQAEGEDEWAEASVEEAIETLQEHILSVIEAIRNEIAEDSSKTPEPAMTARTCNECVNAVMADGHCAKFNIFPPIFVVLDAKVKCQAFEDLDSDIPF